MSDGLEKKKPKYLLVVKCALVLCLALALFLAGAYLQSKGFLSILDQGSALSDYEEGSAERAAFLLDEAGFFLDSYEVGEFDYDKALLGAMNSFVAATNDQYARYFTAKEYKAYMRATEGDYRGIGITIKQDEDKVRIIDCVSGGPADLAGVLPGDVITAIDDASDFNADEAVKLLSVDEGQTVKIKCYRESEKKTLDFELTPTVIDVSSTKVELKDGVAIIHLKTFNRDTGEEVASAIKDLTAKGATSFELDLSDNAGGYLNQAIEITSLFLGSDKPVLKIIYKDGEDVEYTEGEMLTDAPLTVRINGMSASASEVVAAALKDNGRAKIVGTKSYGKGTVQDIRQLSDESAIKFTIAHYLSPNGNAIDGVGVKPDEKVSPKRH